MEKKNGYLTAVNFDITTAMQNGLRDTLNMQESSYK